MSLDVALAHPLSLALSESITLFARHDAPFVSPQKLAHTRRDVTTESSLSPSKTQRPVSCFRRARLFSGPAGGVARCLSCGRQQPGPAADRARLGCRDH